MPSKRHTFTKQRHNHGAIGVLRRIFYFFIRVTGFDMKSRYPVSARSQLTNAEYHLTASQMNKIIRAANSPRDRLILKMLAETGLRRFEITAIRIEDCRLNERLLYVRQGKGSKSRLVPLTISLLHFLKTRIVDRTDGPLFMSARNSGLSTRQINRIVAEAGTKASVTNPNPKYNRITPHLFRHSFARLWKDRGGSIEALSKIMGHQSTATTWDLYGTMSIRDVQKEYQKVINVK
jgi:integrase